MPQSVCVGIGGGSGAGKTTLVSRLLDEFSSIGIVVLEQDWYYRDRASMHPEMRSMLNYDHPDAIESSLLIRHVRSLRAGKPVTAPVYDFTTHTRSGFREITPATVLLVEGILSLYWEDLRQLFDLAVFVEYPEEKRYERRLNRDVRERGRTPESVREQFDQTVRPMHRQFVEPSKGYADWVIMGDESGKADIDGLIEEIHLLVKAQRSHEISREPGV